LIFCKKYAILSIEFNTIGGFNIAFCSKCGAPLSDTALFCARCGAPKPGFQPNNLSDFNNPAQQGNVPQQAPGAYTQQGGVPQQAPGAYTQQGGFPQQGYPPQSAPGFNTAPIKAAGKFAKNAKWLIPLCVVALVIVVALAFSGNIFKSDETLIRDRIQAYEDACNNGDYEAMLECMDSETQALMEGSMSLMDGLFSEGTGLDIGMSDMFGLAGAMGDFYDIEIVDIEIDGDYATVTVVMNAEVYDYSTSSEEAELPMVKEGSDWYIGGLENAIGDELFSLS